MSAEVKCGGTMLSTQTCTLEFMSHTVGLYDTVAGQYCTSYFQSELDQIAVQRQILVGIMWKGLIFKFLVAMPFKEILDLQIFLNLCVQVLVLYLHLRAKRNPFQYK